MKSKFITISAIFSLLVSPVSFGEWTPAGKGGNDSFYVDLDRIRKLDGYLYFWILIDNSKPNEYGTLSTQVYYQGDCKFFKYKPLTFSFHKEPMGGGAFETSSPIDKDWKYPLPDSVFEYVLESLCEIYSDTQ